MIKKFKSQLIFQQSILVSLSAVILIIMGMKKDSLLTKFLFIISIIIAFGMRDNIVQWFRNRWQLIKSQQQYIKNQTHLQLLQSNKNINQQEKVKKLLDQSIKRIEHGTSHLNSNVTSQSQYHQKVDELKEIMKKQIYDPRRKEAKKINQDISEKIHKENSKQKKKEIYLNQLAKDEEEIQQQISGIAIKDNQRLLNLKQALNQKYLALKDVYNQARQEIAKIQKEPIQPLGIPSNVSPTIQSGQGLFQNSGISGGGGGIFKIAEQQSEPKIDKDLNINSPKKDFKPLQQLPNEVKKLEEQKEIQIDNVKIEQQIVFNSAAEYLQSEASQHKLEEKMQEIREQYKMISIIKPEDLEQVFNMKEDINIEFKNPHMVKQYNSLFRDHSENSYRAIFETSINMKNFLLRLEDQLKASVGQAEVYRRNIAKNIGFFVLQNINAKDIFLRGIAPQQYQRIGDFLKQPDSDISIDWLKRVLLKIMVLREYGFTQACDLIEMFVENKFPIIFQFRNFKQYFNTSPVVYYSRVGQLIQIYMILKLTDLKTTFETHGGLSRNPQKNARFVNDYDISYNKFIVDLQANHIQLLFRIASIFQCIKEPSVFSPILVYYYLENCYSSLYESTISEIQTQFIQVLIKNTPYICQYFQQNSSEIKKYFPENKNTKSPVYRFLDNTLEKIQIMSKVIVDDIYYNFFYSQKITEFINNYDQKIQQVGDPEYDLEFIQLFNEIGIHIPFNYLTFPLVIK